MSNFEIEIEKKKKNEANHSGNNYFGRIEEKISAMT